MISLLAGFKMQDFKVEMLFFQPFYERKWRPLSLTSWHFEASEDIMTKFKSQGLHIIRIKYWNASGSGFPPSLSPFLRNIGILLHKQATGIKHFCPECTKYFRIYWDLIVHLNIPLGGGFYLPFRFSNIRITISWLTSFCFCFFRVTIDYRCNHGLF